MKILLVTFPERKDLINFFETDTSNDYYLLNYSVLRFEGENNTFLKGIENLVDHKYISGWLNQLKPDRIIFFEASDIRLIFLNAILTASRYQTLYLDHGIRDVKSYNYVRGIEKIMESQNELNTVSPQKNTNHLFIEFLKHISFAKKLSIVKYLAKFAIKRNKEWLFDQLMPLGNVFTKYIIYCKNNLEVIRLTVKSTPQNIFYTGFPSSDSYFPLKKTAGTDYIVFIDHPYLEAGLYTAEQHKKMVEAIQLLADKSGRKVYVKLHPVTLPANWTMYDLKENIEIVTTFPDPQFYMDATLIVSFSSTMLVNFLSKKKNVVLLSWFISAEHFGNNFSELGICHLSQDTTDIESQFDFWMNNNLAEINHEGWLKFIDNYNAPFDGNARARVVKHITA